MNVIPYRLRYRSSLTPCPHGMTATCTVCKINKPHPVHVGSWMEKSCPYYSGEGEKKNTTICLFNPDKDKPLLYNSK